MKLPLIRLLSVMLYLSLISTFAFAQGGGMTSSISGVVVDTSGGVIPGAEVTVKNNATSSEFKTITAGNGTFSIPALGAGIYTATVTVPNFKVAVYKDISLDAGVPATIRVTLQVGGRSETVIVEAGAEMVQSQTANIAATMNISQIVNLPTGSRSALEGVILSMPGINISGTDTREARVMGLPENMVNITIDGISSQDNYMKSTDGFFSRVRPGVDAMEQVTVSTATPGAESSGAGGVQIKFVTRSGNNEYHGGLYDYLRNPVFDANTWFNNRNITAPAGADWRTWKSPPAQTKLNQFGGRFGGPISLPKKIFGPLGFDGRDKAFVFFNYEELRQPISVTSSSTLFTPEAEKGNFLWAVSGVTQSKNLLDLAAANGFVSTWDPIVKQMLADMSASTSQGSLRLGNDPLVQTLTFTLPSKTKWRYMTGRLDFNLTNKHRLEATWNHNKLFCLQYDTTNGYEPNFPNSPNYGVQCSNRYNGSLSLRSTLTPRLVNEFRSGMSGGPSMFNSNVSPSMFSGSAYNMNGYTVSISGPGITNPYVSSTGSRRNATSKVLEDSLTWSKGSHSLTFGGAFSQFGVWSMGIRILQTPSVTLGVDNTYDPVRVLFDSTNGPKNFPGASSSQLGVARSMYGVLVGSITTLGGTAYLSDKDNKYAFNGNNVNRGHYQEYGFFMQDSWRMRPGLTLNYGLRWELQLPFVPGNDVYSTATIADIWGVSGVGNMFKPGVMTGKLPEFIQYKKGTKAYNQRWKDFAPSFGFAWSPNSNNRWLSRILGESGKTVVRGGYSIAYSRMGMSTYLGEFSGNPGGSLTATRNVSRGNLVSGVGTDQWPLLFRERSRLTPGTFPDAPTYPMTSAIYAETSSMTVFDPNLKTPYAQSWTFGIQREISKSMAIEVRYVGTKSLQGWTTYNYNSTESNMLENGVMDEFKLAMLNLQANVAAGKASSGFKYMGPGTGTYPLPISLAWFNGLPASSATDPTKYSGSNWTSSTNVGYLNKINPSPTSYASILYNDATKRANGKAAGMPANFFLTNPNLLGGVNVQGNGGYTQYDSLVVELRRRMSQGLLVQANYVWAKNFESTRYSFRRDMINDLGSTVPHTFKLNWVLELPFGKGRRFGASAGRVLDRVIGGWEFHGIFRVQSGDTRSFGNVRVVGMTDEELQSVFQLRFDDANRIIYQLPDDIIQNTILAYSFNATSPTGYSGAAPTGRYFAPARGANCISVFAEDCAPRNHYVRGPKWDRVDMSLMKRFRFTEQKNFELRAEFINAFNEVNFSYTTSCTSSSLNTCQVSGTQGGPRTVQITMRLNF
jgi:hypothetical protein